MSATPWKALYRKTGKNNGAGVELAALFRDDQAIADTIGKGCVPDSYIPLERTLVQIPAPLRVYEGNDKPLNLALDLLAAITYGSDEELGATIKKAEAFLQANGRSAP